MVRRERSLAVWRFWLVHIRFILNATRKFVSTEGLVDFILIFTRVRLLTFLKLLIDCWLGSLNEENLMQFFLQGILVGLKLIQRRSSMLQDVGRACEKLLISSKRNWGRVRLNRLYNELGLTDLSGWPSILNISNCFLNCLARRHRIPLRNAELLVVANLSIIFCVVAWHWRHRLVVLYWLGKIVWISLRAPGLILLLQTDLKLYVVVHSFK